MDQNLTTLLSALIGGLLSVSGGFLANYYVKKATKKSNEEENTRKLIEDVYKESQLIENLYDDVLASLREYEIEPDLWDTDPETKYKIYRSKENTFEGNRERCLESLKTSIKKMNLIIKLYLYPLQHDLKRYQSELDPFIKFLESPSRSTENLTQNISKEIFLKAGEQFQLALSRFLKKKTPIT